MLKITKQSSSADQIQWRRTLRGSIVNVAGSDFAILAFYSPIRCGWSAYGSPESKAAIPFFWWRPEKRKASPRYEGEEKRWWLIGSDPSHLKPRDPSSNPSTPSSSTATVCSSPLPFDSLPFPLLLVSESIHVFWISSGVIWKGDKLIEGVSEALQALRSMVIPHLPSFLFFRSVSWIWFQREKKMVLLFDSYLELGCVEIWVLFGLGRGRSWFLWRTTRGSRGSSTLRSSPLSGLMLGRCCSARFFLMMIKDI